MVSLAQAQAVQKLEAEGWMIVEPSSKRAKGGPVMMMRRLEGDAVHILVMPNGGHSSEPPKPRKFEVGNGTLGVQFGIETARQSAYRS